MEPSQDPEELDHQEEREESWLVSLSSKIATALSFVAALWIMSKCTGSGNFLFPGKEIRRPTLAESARRDIAEQIAQLDPAEQRRLGEWERSQGKIVERAKRGEDLLEVVGEEVQRSLATADSFLESLQVSGFWPYLTDNEKYKVREGNFLSLPGDSVEEYMALLRVRRFKGVELWEFMSKEHQDFAASTAFDEMSEERQLEWAEEMLLKCMENGWTPRVDE